MTDDKVDLLILASATNKKGLEKFGALDTKFNPKFISTGGTLDKLASFGFAVEPVESVTEFPEMMDGRLKTIHPKIAGGILADLDNPGHVESMRRYDIRPINAVVVNLYDFMGKPDIEQIDIGGPSLLRAAAKNHKHCLPIPSPEFYDQVIDEFLRTGEVSLNTRLRMAYEVFRITSRYDEDIRAWFHHQVEAATTKK